MSPAAENATEDVTAGTLLGGRVSYAQFRAGYRTGIEPVLTAAAVPAQAGETVLEAGCGAGAGLLCLLHRVPGVSGIGIEIDPATANLARRNIAANHAAATILTADVTAAPLPGADHAMANPPWHDGAATASPDGRRRLALQRGAGDDGSLAWVEALAARLAPRGTITLALPAASAAAALAALGRAGFGRTVLFPLWPRPGRDARLLLVQGRRGSGPGRIAAGLVLHGDGQTYTDAANRILRGGEALTL